MAITVVDPQSLPPELPSVVGDALAAPPGSCGPNQTLYDTIRKGVIGRPAVDRVHDVGGGTPAVVLAGEVW